MRLLLVILLVLLLVGSAKFVANTFRYERVDGPGHWMQWEAPEKVIPLLLDFLLQLLDARQAFVRLPLSRNEVIPHGTKVLLERFDAQTQILVFADGTL